MDVICAYLNSPQGRIQFVMQAHDSDNSTSQLVSTLYVNIDGLMPGCNFTVPQSVNSDSNFFTASLSFRVACTDENYCGINCTTPCRPREQNFIMNCIIEIIFLQFILQCLLQYAVQLNLLCCVFAKLVSCVIFCFFLSFIIMNHFS